jgi:hypothetical protein
VFSLFAKTMRAKRGLLEDGGVELGECDETTSRIVFADTTSGARERGPGRVLEVAAPVSVP